MKKLEAILHEGSNVIDLIKDTRYVADKVEALVKAAKKKYDQDDNVQAKDKAYAAAAQTFHDELDDVVNRLKNLI